VKKETTQHIAKMIEVWTKFSSRYEVILQRNGGEFLVGKELSYADVLVAHALTWYVEECGPDIVKATPLLVGLQNKVVNLPGVRAFIRSTSYYPPGDDAYVNQVTII
jgi:glutathione S-transferase